MQETTSTRTPFDELSASDRRIAMLAAVSIFLSSIEYVIPKPLPFMKLGLANLPILVALTILDIRSILILVALKVVGQGIVHGTLFSYVFLFSAAGSVTSALVMIGVHRLCGRRISLIGVSILGALASNLAQITSARFIVFGESAWLIAPPFLITGTISSALLGAFARRFVSRSRWVRGLAATDCDKEDGGPEPEKR